MILPLFNASLRLTSLGLKLILTLYMAKYLGLSDMGTYGLVAACAAISIPFLGFRIDYVVMRDLVDKPELGVAVLLRNEIVFYLINYCVVAVLAVLIFYSGLMHIDRQIFFFSLVIALLESFTTITSSNMGSLKKPITGNFLFFIRSSLWVVPVIAMGWYDPAYRTANFIFSAWIGGLILSLIMNAFVWRKMPWAEAMQVPLDWPWIWAAVRNTLPIWLSGISAALAANIDRIVVETYLTREMVGVASFYGSFVVAISALLSSGMYAFKYPHLIAHFRANEKAEFRKLTRYLLINGALISAALCVVIGITIPWLGTHFNRPEFATYATTLWLILFSTWLKTTTDGLYYAQYARHQDRDIWIGNFLLLLPSLAFSYLLVPRIGFIGIGFSAVIAAIVLASWRVYSVKTYKDEVEIPAVL